MYLISFYIPETHLKAVTSAMFSKGAGKIGNYDSCAWHTKGIGQFRPLEGSTPFIGKKGEIERLAELKVEMVCKKELIKEVLQELVKVHPYETPSYHAIEILTLDSLTS